MCLLPLFDSLEFKFIIVEFLPFFDDIHLSEIHLHVTEAEAEARRKYCSFIELFGFKMFPAD